MSAQWFHRLHPAPKARAAGSRRRAALRRRPAIESLEGRQLLTAFDVASAADSGAGTLRPAIINSNATPATPTNPGWFASGDRRVAGPHRPRSGACAEFRFGTGPFFRTGR